MKKPRDKKDTGFRKKKKKKSQREIQDKAVGTKLYKKMTPRALQAGL